MLICVQQLARAVIHKYEKHYELDKLIENSKYSILYGKYLFIINFGCKNHEQHASGTRWTDRIQMCISYKMHIAVDDCYTQEIGMCVAY